MSEWAKLIKSTLKKCGFKNRLDYRVVMFRGHKMILMGTLKHGGPLVFELPENWEMSFAHLESNGDINRYGKVIGNRSDLKVISRKLESA